MKLIPILILIAAAWPAMNAYADDAPPVEVQLLDDEPAAEDRASDARESEEAKLDGDAHDARARIAQSRRDRRASGGAEADVAAQERPGGTDEDCGDGPWFWHKPTGVHRGDVLLSWRGGFGAGGGFGGGSAEWMFHERFGLRLMGLFDGVGDRSDFHGKFSGWDFTSGAWGLRGGDVVGSQGFVGLVEPNVTYHFRPGERLDVFASAGVSAFMYRLDEARGGSALVRTSIGLQWFWRAVFVGAEASWYPVELARVVGRREGDVDVFHVDRPPEAFDGRRVTFVAHVGLRL